MSITLLKVTNAGIRVTDDISFPVIKAVIQTDGSATATEMNNIFEEIYSRAGGMVSVCSMFIYMQEPADLIGSAVGNRTWGDDNGFKISVNIPGRQGRYNNWWTSVSTGGIWYKGHQVCYCPSYTGYSNWENVCGIIFVDENNHIYETGGAFTALYMLGSENPGYTVRPGYIVASTVNGGLSLRASGQNTGFTLRDNISGDIINEIDPENTDPYNPGGESGTGGGTGSFDGTGDDVDIPGLPSLSATDTGFITLFNPSAGELRALANYMWSNGFDLDTFKKIFADPMDCILGLSIVPVSVPNGESRSVSVGNISTGITMTTASQQYVEVDCGTLDVNEYWGAYLDYDPYTKAEIYLPYIGTHPIAVDDIMDKSVTVKYHVDILSGACTAFVKCGGSVLYEFIGQCSSSIPISGNDWTNVINGVLTVAGAIGSMVATGGASAPIATGMIASTAVNSMKPNVEKSGSMSGTGGMLAIQTPYLILTRPRQALPKNQNRFTGYPSFITRQLSDISGYTEIESVHLENIGATESELNEIENLLKSGVIF